MYCRGKEHLRALETKSNDSVLWNHCKNHHSAELVQFEMKATGYHSEPLTRQVEEAVRIHQAEPSKLMNRKGEWRKTAVPRVTFSRE